MQTFKTKAFYHWARKIKLHNETLQLAVEEIGQGVYEANLGGFLYKKRVALRNKGKSRGARVIIAFKREDKAIFIYGFSKNQKANITSKELAALKKLSQIYLAYSEDQIKDLLRIKEFIEVKCI